MLGNRTKILPVEIRAAELLEQQAAELKASHVVGDQWGNDECDLIARQDHDRMVSVAKELRMVVDFPA